MLQNISTQFPVLAIDPGYDRAGWAVVKKQNQSLVVMDCGCIFTDKKDSLFDRFAIVWNDTCTLIKKYGVHTLVTETVIFSKNQKTALAIAQLRGVLTAAAIDLGCDFVEFNPNQMKQAVTGNGHASKQAVEKMVRLQLKIPSDQKYIDDTIDALGLALTYFVTNRF